MPSIRRILSLILLMFSLFLLPKSKVIGQVCTVGGLPANLQSGLVAYYPFCGNANDASGNGFNGTVNGATLTTDRFGVANSAYSFNGTSNSITVNGNSQFASSNMTISTWVSFNQFYFNGLQYLVLGNSSGTAWACTYRASSNANNLRKNQGCGTVTDHNYASNFTLNSWYHVVYVISDATVSLYINGSFISSQSSVPFLAACNSYQLNFGLDIFSVSEYLNGKMDDTYIFNRALGTCEITQLYNATSGSIPTLGTFAYSSLSDTTRVCGSSNTLDAGSGYASYSWNTGATTQSITPSISGFYKVTVTNATGCSASDSTWLGLLDARIIQNDTTICLGSSVNLSVSTGSSSGYTDQNGNSYSSVRIGNLDWGQQNLSVSRYRNGDPIPQVTNATDWISRTTGAWCWYNNDSATYGPTYGRLYNWYAVNDPRGLAPLGWHVPTYTEITDLYTAAGTGGALKETGITHWVSPNTGATNTSGFTGLPGGLRTNIDGGGGFYGIGTDGWWISKSSGTPSFHNLLNTNANLNPTTLFGYYNWFSNTTGVSVRVVRDSISYLWSTGATTPSITVSPTQTTTYYVTITDGVTTCTDSVTISVSNLTSFNPFSDTTRICGTSTTLDAGSGYATYSWNSGATTQSISATTGGFYKVTVTNAAGCTASDSTYLSLVNANIINNDTTICRGASVTLNIDSLFPGRTACSANQLPSNLRNGLVGYWPFCGNASDLSGYNNNGTVNGAALTTDRFLSANSSYSFNGTSDHIRLANLINGLAGSNQATLTCWAKKDINTGGVLFGQWISNAQSNDPIGLFYVLNANNTLTVSTDGGIDILSSQAATSTDRWNMYSLVYNSTEPLMANRLRIYQNGVQLAMTSFTVPNNIGSLSNFAAIGARGGGSPRLIDVFFSGKIDDPMVYTRALSAAEISSLYLNTAPPTVTWSTGATTNSITVSPTQTTTYYVTISDGISTCTDSVRVTVSDIGTFNPFSDTTRICGTSTTLDAGSGYATYSWNSGATTQSISATTGGFYKVTVTNAAGCTASDSTYLSLVNANIINNDTTICSGASVTIRLDSSMLNRQICSLSDLPSASLRTGVRAFYPFCNTYVDVSGNGYNGTVTGGAVPFVSDRQGGVSSAVQLGGGYITANSNAFNFQQNQSFSVGIWFTNETAASNGRLLSTECPDNLRIAAYSNGVYAVQFGDYIYDTVSLNSWNHLVYTYENRAEKVYINGVLKYTNTEATNLSFSYCAPFTIGAKAAPAYDRWVGKADDIIVYNRALTPTEVSQLYSRYSITWSTGATTNSITVSPTQSTTYYVTVSDGISVCTDSVRVNVTPLNTVSVASSTPSICVNTPLTAITHSTTGTTGIGTVTGLPAGVTASWASNTITISGTPTQTGTFNYTIQLTGGCGTASATGTIAVTTPPSAGTISVIRQLCSTAALQSALRTSLLSYYPMCGGLTDANGGTALSASNTSLTSGPYGYSNAAYTFNGTNSEMTIPYQNWYSSLTDNFTFSFWIKNNLPLGHSGAHILWRSNTNFSVGLNPNNTINFNRQGQATLAVSSVALSSTWTHVVMIKAGASNKIYINGVLNTDNNNATGLSNTLNDPMIIGRASTGGNGGAYRFNGDLSQMMFYGRVLTAAEVNDLYVNEWMSLCRGSSATLTSTVAGGTWTSSNPAIATINPTTGSMTGIAAGTTTITYTVPGSGGCSSVSTVRSVNVISAGVLNALSDTTRVCGTSTTLDAGAGYAGYSWNTGATTQSISPTTNGIYKVTVTNASGCTASDSTYLILVNANIINADTTICRGASVTLSIDSLFPGQIACNAATLPTNLRTGLLGYWPFCGNATDASGNGGDGTVNGATLTTDRHGNPNSAYSFNGVNSLISVTNSIHPIGDFNATYSLWMKCADLSRDRSLLNVGLATGFNNRSAIHKYVPGNLAYVGNSADYGTSYTPPLNEWHHVVFVKNGLLISVYIDGVFRESGSLSQPRNLTDNKIYFGGNGNSLANSGEHFLGNLDDILIWNRVLTPQEILQVFNSSPTVSWSTGATTNSITVSPTQTTTYYVTVSDGITTCTDSVKVTVNDIGTFNPLSDTTRICGTSTTLNAGTGYASFSWNTGATTQSITPTSSGFYKVTVTNAAGCTASDSTYLSLVNANILNNDTTICKGSSITLSIDSLFPGRTVCNASQLPANLRNGLVGYWPFCGNANDESGNANNGVVNGAALTTDRFGFQSGAYLFDGIDDNITASRALSDLTNLTYAGYVYLPNFNGGHFMHVGIDYLGSPRNGFGFGVGGSQTNTPGSNLISLASNYAWYNSGFSFPFSGSWYFVALTKNGTNVKYYVNGINVGSSNVTIWSPPSNSTFIGCAGPNYGNFQGKLDDLFVYNRTLSPLEVQQLYTRSLAVTWSTGATTNSITVSPTQTTTYYVTVTDGITTCTDSVKVTVQQVPMNSIVQDTISFCGDSVLVAAQPGYSSYLWSTGATTSSIQATSSGWYNVTTTNAAGCAGVDSVYVSIIKAQILQNDTTICRGDSLTLSAVDLRNGLMAWWPFNGNLNDESGNGRHGTNNGASLATDRFGITGKAYSMNLTGLLGQHITVPGINLNGSNSSGMTLSMWYKRLPLSMDPSTLFRQEANCNYPDFAIQSFNSNAYVGLRTTTGGVNGYSGFLQPYVSDTNWHQFSFTYDQSDCKLYMDASLIGVFPKTGSMVSLENISYIGLCPNAGVYGSHSGYVDDIGIWNRPLSALEILKIRNARQLSSVRYLWSNGDTTPNIRVSPTQTTTYYVTVTDGITTCTDSVKVTVSDIGTFNPLSDTTRICGTSTTLNAGTGYASYTWNTGATTQSITPTNSGIYKVTVTNASGCSASDSTYLSLVNANILNNDTTICKGANVTLSIDSLFSGRTACVASGLPSTLRNGLVGYWPFCGNANDASGNGRNGTINGTSLVSDRFGVQNSAYAFDGIANHIYFNNLSINSRYITTSVWVKVNNYSYNAGSALQTYFYLGRENGGSNTYTNSLSQYIDGINFNPPLVATNLNYGYGRSTYLNTSLQWQNYVSVFDGVSKQLKVYLNGSLINTISTLVDSIVISNSDFNYVGAGFSGGSIKNYFKGYVDDFMIWDRALSTTEISQIGNIQTNNVTWSTGATTNSITVSPTQTTTYYATVTDGITTCTDSVKVTVSTVDTSLTVLDPTSICSVNGQVRMQAGVASSYQWLRNGTVISGANAQSYTAVQTGAYRVVVSNAIGCTDTSRTVNITLNPLPVVGFAINDTIQCLTGNNFVFTNTSTIGGGDVLSYLWNFGDGNTATTINAANAYSAPGNYTVTLIATGSSGCVDSSRVTVSVLNSPVASFNINNLSQCITGNNFIFTNTSTSGGGAATYLWNLGDGTTATTQNVTHTYLTPSVYNVTLYVTNSSGCIDSVTQQVIVNVLPSVSFTINDTTQCLTGNQFTFTSTATINPGLLSWQWNLGDGSTSADTVVNHTYATHGTYLVTLVATSDAGCTDSIRQQVYVYPEPIARFTVNDSTQCENGNNFIFNNTSTIAAGPLGFSWNFGDGSPTNSQTSPSHVYQTSGPFVVTLIATGDNGCADTTTRNMLVYPKPVLSFTVNDSTQCVGGNSFVFNNTSTVSAGTNTYVWYFGNGASSPLQNPTYSYPQAGTYTVTLIAITDNGCIDSVRRTMVVYPNPTVRFTVNDTTQCIQGNSFVFTNNTIINPAAALTYQWNFGNGATSTNISPTYVYASPGTYTVTLIANSAEGCIDSARQTVYVYAMPTGTLQTPASTIICQGSSVTLTATGGSTYQWYLGLTAIPGATSATFSATLPGVYTVDIISAQGCVTRATGSVTLTLQVKPRVDFSFDKFCAGSATVFTDLSDVSNSSPASYAWKFGDGGTSAIRNPSHTYTTPGTYNATLIVTPQNCPALRDSIVKPVIVLAPPVPIRYASVNAVKSRDLQLQARPFPQASFSWIPSVGLNNPSIINPIFNYTSEQEYKIRITTPEGCLVIDTLLVRMFENRDILLPRGFSPNGDGKNDKLIPHLVGITTLRYFRVYDRWGQLIYQTNIIGEGWDGTYKGVKQPMETYVWMAEGVDIDGNVIKQTGKTILLR